MQAMEASAPYVRTHRLDQSSFGAQAKRLIIRSSTLFVMAITGGLVLSYVTSVRQGQSADTIYVSAPLILAFAGFVMYRGLRRQLALQRKEWESYELTLGDNVLRRQVADLPAIEIARPEVTRITETANAGLTIATADRHKLVFVPVQLVDYAEARERLLAWAPQGAFQGAGAARAYGIGLGLLMVGAWFATGLPDIRLAMLAGAVSAACCLFIIREVAKSVSIARRTKAAIIGGMILMMLSPVARLLLYVMARH
jgi:hypothetical protein